MNDMHKKKTKDIVYFQSSLPRDEPPYVALPVALFLWKKFPAALGNVVYIKGIFDFYDDLRLLCIVYPGKKSLITGYEKYYRLFLELNYYIESGNHEYSLKITPTSKWLYHKKSIKILAENINQILHSEDVFFNIQWFHLDEINPDKRGTGLFHRNGELK